MDFSKIRRDLFPVLRKKDNFNLDERKEEAIKFIKELMVLTEEEKEYLDMFEKGEYIPSLLFYDNQILENIVEHPMAIWKMQLEQKVEMKF